MRSTTRVVRRSSSARCWPGGERPLGGHQVGLRPLHELHQLLELAGAEVGPRQGALAVLDEGLDHLGPGGAQQLAQLAQPVLLLVAADVEGGDHQGALGALPRSAPARGAAPSRGRCAGSPPSRIMPDRRARTRRHGTGGAV